MKKITTRTEKKVVQGLSRNTNALSQSSLSGQLLRCGNGSNVTTRVAGCPIPPSGQSRRDERKKAANELLGIWEDKDTSFFDKKR